MKKFIALFLSFALLILPGASYAMGIQLPTITLPEDSTVFSPAFAAQALSLCQTDAQALALLGLKVVFQDHFDKDAKDASHTSAYMVCQGQVQYKGESRPLMVVVVRATVGGEWYSNFDCVPSRDANTQYAENFYAAAQDIYNGCKPIFAQVENPLVVLTGYSRGAACANLLGMLMNSDYGTENVFVYTAATPNTVRGEAAKTECPNIFNIINPADMITHMPLSSWGYTRLGTDVVLPADAAVSAKIQATMAQLSTIAPDIDAYYNTRHNLTGPGEGPTGLTAYELLLRFADTLMGTANPATLAAMKMLSPESSLAPVATMFLATASDPASISVQHAPDTYAQLFAKMQMMLMLMK